MPIRTQVKMPQFGETVREGTVVSWLKNVGDLVDQGEALCEIATDKVETQLESPVAGRVVEIAVVEKETVAVGVILCKIEAG